MNSQTRFLNHFDRLLSQQRYETVVTSQTNTVYQTEAGDTHNKSERCDGILTKYNHVYTHAVRSFGAKSVMAAILGTVQHMSLSSCPTLPLIIIK